MNEYSNKINEHYMKMWYDNISEEIEKNKYLIMLGLNDKELDEMKTEDNIINKFKTSITQVNKDPEFIEYMSEEKDRMKKQNTLIYQAEEKGKIEGIAQGKAEGISIGEEQGIVKEKRNTAKNMLKKNMSIEDISEITGLTLEEINKLKD